MEKFLKCIFDKFTELCYFLIVVNRRGNKTISTALAYSLMNKENAVKLLNILRYGKLTCEICAKPIGKSRSKKLSIDHILAKSNGGSDEFTNLRIAHRGCNMKKGNNLF